jgi:hypothetical protein
MFSLCQLIHKTGKNSNPRILRSTSPNSRRRKGEVQPVGMLVFRLEQHFKRPGDVSESGEELTGREKTPSNTG